MFLLLASENLHSKSLTGEFYNILESYKVTQKFIFINTIKNLYVNTETKYIKLRWRMPMRKAFQGASSYRLAVLKQVNSFT